MIAEGGPILRAIAPSLGFAGLDKNKVKLLGTGLWDDPSIAKEDMLLGGWFAAPAPDADDAFNGRFHDTFGSNPPQLASLAYDAIALVALLVQWPALSPLYPGRADGSQRLFRGERNFPLQRRRHFGARPGGAGSGAGWLSCREPCAQDLPAARGLIQKAANHGIQQQPALRRGGGAHCPSVSATPCSIRPAIFAAAGRVPQRTS